MNAPQHSSRAGLIRAGLAASGRWLLLSFTLEMASLVGPAANAASSTLEVLLNFDSTATGAYPVRGLMQGTDGMLYGATSRGGANDAGTLFKLNPDGSNFVVLLHFDGATTGARPLGALMQGTDGVLYGTTSRGGANGDGTVFKLNPEGSGFTVLRHLDNGTTGAEPWDSLLQGADGALYGTTFVGGNGYLGGGGPGTVFKLNTDGSGFSVLQNFDYLTTGGHPIGGLIQGMDGALYGTAQQGGEGNGGGGGTVYKLNPDGTAFTVLWVFDLWPNGLRPSSKLVQGTDGVLYGTARQGGDLEWGTVFKLNPDGTGFALLHTFDLQTGGGFPTAELVQGTDDTIYGTAVVGGINNAGTVFRLKPDGTDFAVLHHFQMSTTGGNSSCGLVLGTDGAIYGMTTYGGVGGVGTVFRLTLNEPPVITGVGGPLAPLVVDSMATVDLTFGDESPDDTHTIVFSWGDGTLTGPLPATVGLNEASHVYSTPGVYRVEVAVTDAAGDTASSAFQYVVVYDPEGGFVTGGGWISSPAGAYTANPTLTGKANFGFVAKYQKGANVPSGSTEFQFKAGDLNFKSTSYDWLVVAGAKGKFKGSGTINGAGDYAFQLTATDGQANGGGADRFRIKIWSKSGSGVIYDNQPGASDDADATTELGGGSIVIHKP